MTRSLNSCLQKHLKSISCLDQRAETSYQDENCLEEILKNTSTFSLLLDYSALVHPDWDSLRAGK